MSLEAKAICHLEQMLGKDGVVSDEKRMARYCRDQSIYSILPAVVLLPRNTEEISAIVKFAREAEIPITPRGGGSSTAGGCLGRGMVIALPREGQIANIGNCFEDKGRVSVTVGAGAIHSSLQDTLARHGYFLPADPSSAKICRVGG